MPKHGPPFLRRPASYSYLRQSMGLSRLAR